MTEKPQRIAKFIAHAGICSRREAERLIEAGDVTVDGKILNTPAFTVTSANEITINGKKINARVETKLWLFNKPKGCITSNKDPEGRPTVFEQLPPNLPRVVTVGRLDYNTEGLLLLTNNGELARYFEHPKYKLKRTYRVRVMGLVTQEKLDKMEEGVTVKDDQTGRYIKYGQIEVSKDNHSSGRNTWLVMSIWEGKNREIRRICDHFDLSVNRLIRTDYGPLQLGSLPSGELMEIPEKLMKQAAKGFEF